MEAYKYEPPTTYYSQTASGVATVGGVAYVWVDLQVIQTHDGKIKFTYKRHWIKASTWF